jgi:hypothetical protein
LSRRSWPILNLIGGEEIAVAQFHPTNQVAIASVRSSF